LRLKLTFLGCSCSLMKVYRRFRGSCCFYHYSIAPMMEAADTSKTSVNFYQTTRRNISKDRHLLTLRRENLKSGSNYVWTCRRPSDWPQGHPELLRCTESRCLAIRLPELLTSPCEIHFISADVFQWESGLTLHGLSRRCYCCWWWYAETRFRVGTIPEAETGYINAP
jgi:hypothetical protein